MNFIRKVLMKKLSAILICLMLVIGGCKTGGSSGGGADLSIPAAGPEDYTDEDYGSLFKMWEEFDIGYTDADKNGTMMARCMRPGKLAMQEISVRASSMAIPGDVIWSSSRCRDWRRKSWEYQLPG